jgi:two-component sensor histidine kinase
MIGNSIMRIIPNELAHEEAEIIEHVSRGDRVEHFDTERVRKDGKRVSLSLTISPIRSNSGRIVGASKIARDITERRLAEELQRLLVNEINHRVKNALATVQALAAQSLRRSGSPADFVKSFNGRLQSLAQAHDLLVRGQMKSVSLADLVRGQVFLGKDDRQVHVAGPEAALPPEMAVQFGLVLHELATNARKYGALRDADGSVDIQWTILAADKLELVLEWREVSASGITKPLKEGFGTGMIKKGLANQGGSATFEYLAMGIKCQVRLPMYGIDFKHADDLSPITKDSSTRIQVALKGKKALVVEDEHIIGLEIVSILTDAGMEVIGPAGTIDQARSMILADKYDIVLLDANLQGQPVGELASLLIQRGSKFIICTGYGRDALPVAARQAPILSKPFSEQDLRDLVLNIL